ncbi:hypothetical protein D9619_010708 [Psilocybe cf. subviscida]|uniref:Phosphoglycerate mutase-like protein n=1 Tax=Psilocybe cf. subviscida TaxID=2480587 RepID=A0A8H5F090_9AGAR|nr:hypothetical protein D9619_010708 [Psilocybe cf. subviscida]
MRTIPRTLFCLVSWIIFAIDLSSGTTLEGRNCPETSVANSIGSMVKTRPQVPLDVEGYLPAPDNLKLEQVHVFVRHGERTPVGVRLAGPPANIPEYWPLCKTANRFQATVASVFQGKDLQDEHIKTRKVVERRNGMRADEECLLGELTDVGRQSTYNFGVNLRKLYIDRLGFIPDILSDKNITYFRSTNMPRTTESLQQVIHGLYPTHKCHPQAYPDILLRNGKDENLIGNTYACKRLEVLQIGFAHAAAQAYNPTLEHLDKKVSKYINGNPIRVDGKPRASGVMDTIRASIAHGIKVPPEFEDKSVVDVIEQAVVSEWFSDKTEEVRRLGMGPLLSDIATKMQRKIDDGEKEQTKLLVHSTHDTALAALAATLDVFDEKWPAFTASMTFELFKKRPDTVPQPVQPQSILKLGAFARASPQYYIRLRYQNKDMALPICAAEGNHLEGHPEFCTFAAFKARVRELTPTDWDGECMPSGRA